AARNICPAFEFAQGLEGDDEAIHRQVEKGKKRFVGFELPGRTLGVIGLGAIGVKVANAAVKLGMKVLGYDPKITVERAWQLSSEVEQATGVDDLLTRADMVSFHVPLTETTRHLINRERLRLMKPEAVILNFARAEIVDDEAVVDALEADRLRAYVCDFPSNALKRTPKAIALPHIGASTKEAEDNCAIMVVDEVRDYLENGNVHHSVNFPEVRMPRIHEYRIAVVNDNIPKMLGRITDIIGDAGVNIIDMHNDSRGSLAYTLADIDKPLPPEAVEKLQSIQGVRKVRTL
ncbi:MAG: 3-phosphoglycerate dehydrogenase, partial [Gammaproteobacteria bacterium]